MKQTLNTHVDVTWILIGLLLAATIGIMCDSSQNKTQQNTNVEAALSTDQAKDDVFERCKPPMQIVPPEPFRDMIHGSNVRFDLEYVSLQDPYENWEQLYSYQQTITREDWDRLVNTFVIMNPTYLKDGFIVDTSKVIVRPAFQIPYFFEDIDKMPSPFVFYFANTAYETSPLPSSSNGFRLREALIEMLNEKVNTTRTQVDSSGTKPKRLQGVRILLDPGHMGHEEGEGRIIYHLETGEPYSNEAIINLAVALWAEKRLTELGALVKLTKRKLTSIRKDQLAWADLHYPILQEIYDWVVQHLGTFEKVKALGGGHYLQHIFQQKYEEFRTTPELRHRAFNRRDMMDRVIIAHQFKPDVWISIHHNAWDGGYFRDDITPCIMAFTAGAFARGELSSEEERYHFLRHMVSGTLEDSRILADHLMKTMHKRLNLPLAVLTENETSYPPEQRALFMNHYPYLVNYSKYLKKQGVYSRNLYLTRKMPGVGVLLEGGFFTDPHEVRLLTDCTTRIEGIPISQRAIDYAEAIVEGILGYLDP